MYTFYIFNVFLWSGLKMSMTRFSNICHVFGHLSNKKWGSFNYVLVLDDYNFFVWLYFIGCWYKIVIDISEMKHGHKISQMIVHDYVRWCKMLIYVHIEIHQYMAWQINLYVCSIWYIINHPFQKNIWNIFQQHHAQVQNFGTRFLCIFLLKAFIQL